MSSRTTLAERDLLGSLRQHVGAAAVVSLATGAHAITIFDWSMLDEEQQGEFAEAQLGELRSWVGKLTPFALLGGETTPVPMDELDQQTDGVLLIENVTGAVVHCSGPSATRTEPVAGSVDALSIK